jgi:hypothetical protein
VQDGHTRDLNITFSRGSELDGGDFSPIQPLMFPGEDVMTPALCSAICTGFKFFGVQDTNNCFCGNDYGNQGGKAPEDDCDSPCSGDSSAMCGGPFRNSIYAQPSTALNSISNKLASANEQIIVSNLTGTCLTVLGEDVMPFNVMNTQPCQSGRSSQRWIYDPSTGKICSGLNGYCLFTYATGLRTRVPSDFLFAAPKKASEWAFNQTSGAIFIADGCSALLNIADAVLDGSEPIHVDSSVPNACHSPKDNEVWHFETPV